MQEVPNDRSFTPDGWHTVTVRIVVPNARELLGFLARVFGATGEFQESRPSEIRIGDSIVMVSEVGVRGHTPAFLYVYVANTDQDDSPCFGEGRQRPIPPSPPCRLL
jgi:hypothetical protein